jgi:hypothetical protein
MTEAEFEALKEITGLKGYTKEQFSRLVIGDAKTEAIICDVLGLNTEAEKTLCYTKWGFYIVLIATLFALGSFVAAVIPYLRPQD